MRRRFRHIALLGVNAVTLGQDLIRGIYQYARPDKPWIFESIPVNADAISTLRAWKADGVIAFLASAPLARQVRSLRMPVVNVSAALWPPPAPSVLIDNRAVGEVAARHFLDRGFLHFGYIGYPERAFSFQREDGFRETLRAAGRDCHVHQARLSQNRIKMHRALWQWARRLPKPVAVFAVNDEIAARFSKACFEGGVRVPEDVSILGVDNNEFVCEGGYPDLSSVEVPGARIGTEAARLLDRLLAGRRPPPAPILLPPIGVVTRRSTDVLAVSDADVANALRFIREHAGEPITVADVLRAVPVSRRQLETRLKSLLKRSPRAEIRRVHLERARGLLARSDLPMPQVAARSGFNDASHFTRLFRRMTGLTPTAYRRQMRRPC